MPKKELIHSKLSLGDLADFKLSFLDVALDDDDDSFMTPTKLVLGSGDEGRQVHEQRTAAYICHAAARLRGIYKGARHLDHGTAVQAMDDRHLRSLIRSAFLVQRRMDTCDPLRALPRISENAAIRIRRWQRLHQ